MLPKHFNGLTWLSQERLLQLQGVLLGTVENETTRTYLYQLAGF
ncbi:MAG TPA: hypothetical protein VMR70_14715 [Flavisolibacter sp.]|nr:hypothetical protein [Flavisolibacter sp.]